MADGYVSDRARMARTLMQMNPQEPAPGQQAGVLDALGIVLPGLMAGRAASGAASVARQFTGPKPYVPTPRSPGFTPMDVSNAKDVPVEETLALIRQMMGK